MKQLRAIRSPRPRKVIVRACVFLLLGAIVNIAVAWGCGAFSHYLFDPTQDHSHVEPNWIVSVSSGFGITRVSGVPDNGHWGMGDVRGRVNIPTWSRTTERPSNAEFQDRAWPWTVEYACGWPMRAGVALVRRSLFDAAGVRATSHRFEVVSGIAVLDDGSGDPMPYRVLPVRPIWSGFAINTLFYAAILWLLFALPFALRRMRRIKRGLCPACAYPIGASDLCTECGEPVRAT